MIDIKPGDTLVVGAKEYPVRSAADWQAARNTTIFRRTATLTASTKRGTASGDKISPASTHLTGLKCTPLDPVSAELASTAGLDTPSSLRQTFVGDSTGVLHLIIEDLQR